MLPHNSHLDSRSGEELLLTLSNDPTTEVDLAASKHFYDVGPGFDFHPVMQAYSACFALHQKSFTEVLGEPVYQGNWNSPDLEEWTPLLPEFASAMHLTVWKRGEQHLYLRQGSEDKETPILIALGVEGCDMTGIAYPGQFD
jgi:hypothetical protein